MTENGDIFSCNRLVLATPPNMTSKPTQSLFVCLCRSNFAQGVGTSFLAQLFPPQCLVPFGGKIPLVVFVKLWYLYFYHIHVYACRIRSNSYYSDFTVLQYRNRIFKIQYLKKVNYNLQNSQSQWCCLMFCR